MSSKATAKIIENDFSDIHDYRDKFTEIPYSERILLLPHCLRKSSICKAVSDENGLKCLECNDECQVNILRKAAISAGYRGVCIAPGGSLALKYVQKTNPRAITAVACDKELKEGIENVKELIDGKETSLPLIDVIPLTKEGCIDTEVEIEKALHQINNFCEERNSRIHTA